MSNPLLDFVSAAYARNLNLMVAKNADYGAGEDPLANFRLAETLGICSVEQAILVRLCDKVARTAHLLQHPPAVKGESFQDTCDDGANYFEILAFARDRRAKGEL